MVFSLFWLKEIFVFWLIYSEEVLFKNILDCEMATFDALALVLLLLSWISPSSSWCHLLVPSTLWLTRSRMLHGWFIWNPSTYQGLFYLAYWFGSIRQIWNLYRRCKWEISLGLTDIVNYDLHMFSKKVRSNLPIEETLGNILSFKFENELINQRVK